MWWWLAACGPEPEPKDPTDPPGTTPSTGDNLRGLRGSIAVVEHAPDPYSGNHVTDGFALFVRDDPGIRNLAECALLGPPCVTEPGRGEGPAAQVPVPDGWTAVDAGSRIRVGDGWLNGEDGDFGPAYVGDDIDLDGADHQIHFDGDLVRFHDDGALVAPDALRGLSPDPARIAVLGAGEAFEVAWTPGGVGDVEVRWPGTATIEVHTLDDDGAYTVGDDAALGLRAPLDATWVSLARTLHTPLDTDNDVTLDVRREQLWYVDYVATDGWTDLSGSPSVTDTCGGTTPLPDGAYYGDLLPFAGDYDLGQGNPLTGWPTQGADAVFPVDLAPGDTLEVLYRQVWLDAAVFVLDDGCLDVIAAADDTYDAEQEVLTFTSPAGGRFHVVLDGFLGAERFAVQTRTIPAPE